MLLLVGTLGIQKPVPASFGSAHVPERGEVEAREVGRSTRGRRGLMARNSGNGPKQGALGIEADLFRAADTLRGSMEPSDYKHVVLGLIFLKHISDTFEAKHAQLLEQRGEAAAEDQDRYTAENIFWVPKESRWTHLLANAKQPDIGRRIDDAMIAIERVNPRLKDVLPKDYTRPALSAVRLGELIDLVGNVTLQAEDGEQKDLLGRVYEYFLSQFAGSEGRRGGEFYTPRSVVRLLVEMLEPYEGRVYDPCCGSGGMFVQSEKFVEEHGGRLGDIAIYGQELNHTTWRLCMMNLAVRGIEGDIRWNNQGTFLNNALPDLRFDYALANPPFNVSDWSGEKLRDDARWKYGAPPVGNANYAWLQHILHHLAPNGTAGVILANGSMSSNTGGEGDIRKAMFEGEVVDCMVALPGQLFYSTQIPVCVWFLAKNKENGLSRKGVLRDRRGEVLFIDARTLGTMVDRTRKDLTPDDIAKVAGAYHAWRERDGYEDVPGFCRAASLDDIREHQYVLTPGRYVGAEDPEDEGEPFEEKMQRLATRLQEHQVEATRLDTVIRAELQRLGYG
jgi:type I restriction enzyme M protein